ncbi:MAG: class I SAM-dependent methyltransferase [Desulfatiglandaceae bacterium]
MTRSSSYLMESLDEAIRLELKTDPEALRKQAMWCGLRPGLRVLDVGCGPGKTSSILHEMVQPGGELVGLDFSEQRIGYAREHYGQKSGIEFQVRDFTSPLDGLGYFDLIWVRFILEYHRVESPTIVKNLTTCLKPGGTLSLLDLDHNCLNHYELPAAMEPILFEVMGTLEKKYNFDPYAGRKLYAYLYDLGYEDIQVELIAHHLIYGELRDVDAYNWLKKVEVVSTRAQQIFEGYPGGRDKFLSDFVTFLNHPRRFTYTPLILCKGLKPVSA